LGVADAVFSQQGLNRFSLIVTMFQQ
jgi:hypothetical protein